MINLDVSTRGKIVGEEIIGSCMLIHWFRRTMHGAEGELVTSLVKGKSCLDSVTSRIKFNEIATPQRHIEKIKKMIKKGGCEDEGIHKSIDHG